MLRDQLRRQVVVELAGLHPTATVASRSWTIATRCRPSIAAALERARLQVEALAQTADELEVVLPDAVGRALRDGLREEAAPISRRLAEVKGLSNKTIRRLERLETDRSPSGTRAIDDLALLVDLLTEAGAALNARLDRIERRSSPRGRTS